MTDTYLDREHWSTFASEWIAWASAPGADAFWAYRESLLAFIGKGAGKALEVGCGEGRVSRVVKECGYRVTATDPVAAFVAAATRAGSAKEYAVAAAGHLPFGDGSFDLVVAYNILMDAENVPAAV
jgi:ubiquinone/menaquinone biosynthesis C-methylase UbiE